MNDNTPGSLEQTLPFPSTSLHRLTWAPILIAMVVIALFWITGVQTVWPSPGLDQFLYLGSAILGIVFIAAAAGYGFLRGGFPTILMLGCATLTAELGVAATVLIGLPRGIDKGYAIFNTSVLFSALCHMLGVAAILLRRQDKLRRPALWLAATYSGSAVITGGITWLAITGRMPVFFIDGQGGTIMRSMVVSFTVATFLLTADLLWLANRRLASPFFRWYAQGLILTAIGLTGSMLITVANSPLQWATKLTQFTGLVYLCVAVQTIDGKKKIEPYLLAAIEEELRESIFPKGIRKLRSLWWILRYGLAIVSITASILLQHGISEWFGVELPHYITLYPAVMAVAVLGGFGPGIVSTVLAGLLEESLCLPRIEQFTIADRLGLVTFAGMGFAISALAEFSRNYRRKVAEHNRNQLLYAANARLAIFAKATFEGIVESKDGRILDCNEQFARIIGYPVSELVGMEIDTIVAPEDRDRVREYIRQNQDSVQEQKLLRKDGTCIIVEAHGESLSFEGTARCCAIRDITHRKQAEQALYRAKEEWERTFDSVPDLIAILDRKNRIIRINRAMTEKMGCSPDDCIGMPCHMCLHCPDEPQRHCPHAQTLLDGKEHAAELFVERWNGHFLVTTTAYRDEGGQVIGTIHVARDITEKKRKEEHLRQLNRTLRAKTRSIEAMMHATEETGYVQEVCRIIAEDCGHVMVWIGYAEDDAGKTVRPMASYGLEDGYLDRVNISWDDTEYGRGPAGTAIRTGRPSICRNIQTDPCTGPWRAEAAKRGYASAICLPLLGNAGHCFGAITIYSSHEDPFTEQEIELLTELADNLAYGILSLRLRIEHLKSEQALRKSQTLLNSTQKLAKIGGWDYDVLARRVTWSEEVYRIYGVSPASIDPTNLDDLRKFYTPRDYERVRRVLHDQAEHGTPFDLELGLVSADGQERWVRIQGETEFRSGKPVRLFGSIIDITELHNAYADLEKANQGLEMRVAQRTSELRAVNEGMRREIENRLQAERALRETEARWRSYIEDAPYGILLIDEQGNLLKFNPEACRITGYTEAELLSMGIADLLPADSRLESMEGISAVKREGRVYLEIRCAVKNAEQRWMAVAAVKLTEDRFLTFISDISERRRMAADLKASEERFRALVNATPDLIFSLDRERRFTAVNSAVCRGLGMPEKEIIGRQHEEIAPLTDHTETWHDLGEKVLAGEVVQVEMTLPLPVSGLRNCDVVLYPIITSEGTIEGISGIVRDITEQRQAEAQLRQAQKIDAIGLLAGGVAHDFNNLLTVILGYSDMLVRRFGENDPARKDVVQIVTAGQKAANLTRQLLAFSRKQTIQPVVLDLNTVVDDIGKMLKRLIGENITFHTLLADDLCPVKADPGQIEQIIMNIAINARDAMPQGGILTIKTETIFQDKNALRRHKNMEVGFYTMLTISDTGMGMNEETMSKIFEPFFTTKEKGKGTGLGLPTVYGIIAQSRGRIEVKSKPGQGSVFTIFLPCVDGEVQQEVASTTLENAGKGEQILIVEDDDSLLKLLQSNLAKIGYRPVIAANGGAALLAIEEQGLRPDLLLTDVIMPGMSGVALVRQLRKTNPTLKVLFMSGYTDNAFADIGELKANMSFIQKPFNFRILAQKIRRVLDDTLILEKFDQDA